MWDRVDGGAASTFWFDRAARDYVRNEVGFRMVKVTEGREALQVERLVPAGLAGCGAAVGLIRSPNDHIRWLRRRADDARRVGCDLDHRSVWPP